MGLVTHALLNGNYHEIPGPTLLTLADLLPPPEPTDRMQTHTLKCPDMNATVVFRNGSSVEVFFDAPKHSGDLTQFTMQPDTFRAFAAFMAQISGQFAHGKN